MFIFSFFHSKAGEQKPPKPSILILHQFYDIWNKRPATPDACLCKMQISVKIMPNVLQIGKNVTYILI